MSKNIKLPKHLQHININAAGIDIGSTSHFVAVPEDRCEESVREFKTFTPDLHELATWLKECKVDTVAMESTSVYWIPVYELLEEKGFKVLLVNAKHIKNVSGRKSDVSDCQWIQQLHTYGLLSGAFRPDEDICQLRSYVRQRDNLIQCAGSHIQHMQKALDQMNIRLHNVISDITGVTGQKIIRAIVEGERDPKELAKYRDKRCKNDIEIIEKSLIGNYKEEHIFALKQALELYDFYQAKITECDKVIEEFLKILTQSEDKEESEEKKIDFPKKKKSKNTPKFELQEYLYQLARVDCTAIDGIDSLSVLKIISEIGTDMSKWETEKHFGSWLGLSPETKISGGKVLSRGTRTKSSANRVATILRICANTLYNSATALGAFLRRQKARLGSPKAITATAYKLAKIIYYMLKYKMEYVDVGKDYYEKKYRERMIKNMKRKAQLFGYKLVEIPKISENPKNKDMKNQVVGRS